MASSNFEKWFIYQLAPIDDWGGWMPASEALSASPEYDSSKIPADLYGEALAIAKQAAEKIGWNEEDEIREIYVAGIPNGDGNPACFQIAWKQMNNGTTFVWSPYPFPHLEEENPKNYVSWQNFQN